MADAPRIEQTQKLRTPWNTGKLTGPKPPLKVREIWAIRIRLQLANKLRGWGPGHAARPRCRARRRTVKHPDAERPRSATWPATRRRGKAGHEQTLTSIAAHRITINNGNRAQ
jgi:hypothetical protein